MPPNRSHCCRVVADGSLLSTGSHRSYSRNINAEGQGDVMSNEIVIHKGRTNTITVDLGIDVSADEITSEIRTEPSQDSPLIATWEVSFETDGADGKLVLVLDDVATAQIKENAGYMDLKRITGGEPVPVFDRPLEVSFRGTVTV